MIPRAHSRHHIIYTIAIIGFIYTLHGVLPMYSNSSFLSVFADEYTVGYIYMFGAAISVLGFLLAPGLIRRFGNYATVMCLIVVQIGLFYGLVASDSPIAIAILFSVQTAVIAMIGLCVDIFLEHYTTEQQIGTVRGLFNATLNSAWLVAPLLGTMLISGSNNYRNTYVAALAMLFPLLYLIYKNFPRFHDDNYTHPSLYELARHIGHNRNWVKLFTANAILQTFYAWMVVYCAIYLNTTMGFGWQSIGIILTVMLLPFALIQYPLGKLSDHGEGEKKMMAIGFAIMGAATITLSLINIPSIFLWALVLFISRIGAAMAEIMIETYFFKTVSVRDTAVLGVFRVTRPAAYFLAPIITMVGLLFTTSQYLFAIVGVITLLAIYPVLSIRDTR
jgi:MFS family permease